LIRFSGVAKDANRKPLTGTIGITFLLYKDEQGSAPLWMETQNVQPDANGHYSVQLGSTQPNGLPTDVFTSGEARWLGVQPQGQGEQPRILLMSVPYALKAGDAETLGGLPATAFAQAKPSVAPGTAAKAQTNGQVTSSSPAKGANSANLPSVTGSGTTNFVPVWTGTSTLGNSALFQSGGNIGLGTTTPRAKLEAVGGAGVGLRASTTSSNATGAVWGDALASSGISPGVRGHSASTSGTGVVGNVTATTGNTVGTAGNSFSSSGTGVFGNALATSGSTVGILGQVSSSNGTALVGINGAGGKVLSGQSRGTEVFSVLGTGTVQIGSPRINGMLNIASNSASLPSLSTTGFNAPDGSNANGTDGIHAAGGNADPTGGRFGGTGMVVAGGSADWPAGTGGTGLVSFGGNGSGADGIGSPGGVFVGGYGEDFGGAGATFTGGSCSVDGIHCAADPDGIDSTTTTRNIGGYAGNFAGDINVTGAIFAGTKDFKIDHPLDPANKYLLHASVESSEMKNIYDGVVDLDGNGEAVVQLPDWFEAVNRDFRYQLTCIGGFAPVYIAQKIQNHSFRIAGGTAGLEISWQVTGVRHDAYAKANPLIVEQEKKARERGYYIHPELYGAPEEKGIEWARNPAWMRQAKQIGVKRLEAVQHKDTRP
jgi:hypothetical protein